MKKSLNLIQKKASMTLLTPFSARLIRKHEPKDSKSAYNILKKAM